MPYQYGSGYGFGNWTVQQLKPGYPSVESAQGNHKKRIRADRSNRD